MNPIENLKRTYAILAIMVLACFVGYAFIKAKEDRWKMEQYELRIGRGEQLSRQELLVYCQLLHEVKGIETAQCSSLMDAYRQSVVSTLSGLPETREVRCDALGGKVTVGTPALIASVLLGRNREQPYRKGIALMAQALDIESAIKGMKYEGSADVRGARTLFFSAESAGYALQIEIEELGGSHRLSRILVK